MANQNSNWDSRLEISALTDIGMRRSTNQDSHVVVTAADPETWLERGQASGAAYGYAFFKHEDDGAGPALAASFLELADAGTARKARGPQAAQRTRRSGQTKTA